MRSSGIGLRTGCRVLGFLRVVAVAAVLIQRTRIDGRIYHGGRFGRLSQAQPDRPAIIAAAIQSAMEPRETAKILLSCGLDPQARLNWPLAKKIRPFAALQH